MQANILYGIKAAAPGFAKSSAELFETLASLGLCGLALPGVADGLGRRPALAIHYVASGKSAGETHIGILLAQSDLYAPGSAHADLDAFIRSCAADPAAALAKASFARWWQDDPDAEYLRGAISLSKAFPLRTRLAAGSLALRPPAPKIA